ncbi:MAG: deoxyribonuclease IV [Thermomicrobiales bacterium]
MRLGAHMSTAGGAYKALERAAGYGMDACQIFTKNQRQWAVKAPSEDDVAAFHAKVTEVGIAPSALVAHASYLINLASPDDTLWEKSSGSLAGELRSCDSLGVPILVVHPGAHVGAGTEAGLARVVAALDGVYGSADAPESMTLLETTAGTGTTLGATLEELWVILAAVARPERVGICLDTCHLFAAGYDYRAEADYRALVTTIADTVGLEAVRAIHLNDSRHGLGSHKDRHAHIGEGEIGREGFGWFLRDDRWADLPGILETEKGDDGEGDRKNMAILRALAAGAA